MEKFVIDLGKGVELSAPIKKRMTIEEWHRMVSYISNIIEMTSPTQLSDSPKNKLNSRGK